MATKAWFNYSKYMENKLVQMQETYPDENWTSAKLTAAFEKAGFVGDSGAQAHFLKYGHTEDVSPNAYFDAEYYYKAKAIQYYTGDEGGNMSREDVLAKIDEYATNMKGAIKAAGMDAWTHYVKYGTAEGVNPSNSFDTADYMAAKVTAMAGSMTEAEVYDAFKKAGFNALSHFMQYAGKGDNEVPAGSTFEVPEEEQINIQEEGDSTTFTKDIDNLKGTNGNDTFEGVQGTTNTYQTADKLVDPSTSDEDVLNVTLTSNGLAAQEVTVTNVETINVVNKAGDGAFSASGITGAKQINAEVGDSKSLEIQNIQELTTAVGLSGRGNLTVSFDSQALEGDSPAVNLSLSGAGKDADNASTVNLDGNDDNSIVTVNVETTGNNFVNLTAGDKAATYTITGDGVNTLTLAHAVKSDKAIATQVDASDVESAAQTVILAHYDEDADEYVTESLVKDDSLTGGAGTEDTLIFAADKDGKKAVATVKGFENITVKASGAAEVDATNFADVKALTVESYNDALTDTLTVKGLAATVATVNLDDGVLGDVSLTWAAAPSSLTVNVGSSDDDYKDGTATGALTFNTATSAVVNSVAAVDSRVTNTIADIQGDKLASLTLNATDNDLVVSDISSAPALKSLTVDTGEVGKGVFELTANGATGLTSMTVTGDGAATFGALANTAALKMDASEFTGDLTADFTGGTGAVTLEYKGDTRTTGTITTGNGGDDITVGNGTNTITAGAGDDSITLGDGKDTVRLADTAVNNGSDEISGFTHGSDKLAVSSAFIATLSEGTMDENDATTIAADTVFIVKNEDTLSALDLNDFFVADGAKTGAAGKFNTTVGAANTSAVIAIACSDGTAVYYVKAATTTLDTENEVNLVATLDETTDLTFNDFSTWTA